jgi:hypothetical protein
MTKKEIIYQILMTSESGLISNDNTLSYELVSEWVDEFRALLIGQELSKNASFLNDTYMQNICVDLTQVDSSLCLCDVQSGCYILKSTQKIPSTIDSYLPNNINSVVTPLGKTISETNIVKQRYNKYNKYTNNASQWYLQDNYLYIINEDLLETVNITGIFENPEDVSKFTCAGKPCFTDDSEYPVSSAMVTMIMDIIIEKRVKPFYQSFSDISNDANSQTPKQIIDNKQAK